MMRFIFLLHILHKEYSYPLIHFNLSKTPFRLTLGGGGTDLPSFYREHGGFVLAVGIDKHMYLNVNTPILDDGIRVQYSQTELVQHVDELQHRICAYYDCELLEPIAQ